jgi:hypothetical protein
MRQHDLLAEICFMSWLAIGTSIIEQILYLIKRANPCLRLWKGFELSKECLDLKGKCKIADHKLVESSRALAVHFVLYAPPIINLIKKS